MPQQYPLNHQQYQQQPFMTETYIPHDNSSLNMFASPRQSAYNNYPTYQPPQPQPQTQRATDTPNINKPDFHRFYGPVSVCVEKFSIEKKNDFLSPPITIKQNRQTYSINEI